MDLQMEGKRALVTGSSGGIGEGIAKTLAAEKVTVVVHGRQKNQVDRVAADITDRGGQCCTALGDLSTDEGAAKVAEHIRHELGAIDILINNVGPYPEGGWMETPVAGWVDVYDRNVGTIVRMTQLLVPDMVNSGWGRVINISSRTAQMPSPVLAAYSAAKAATVNLSVSLAKELTASGVTVNVVSPGVILTAGAKQMFLNIARDRGWGEDWNQVETHIVRDYVPNPCGRIGRVEEMAATVAFLCSPKAGYINGANIRVDGGTIPTTN